MTDFIDEKIDNFKQFILEISSNTDDVKKYQTMSKTKLQAFVMLFLAPRKDDLDGVVREMQNHLVFADEHRSKVKKYLELFIEYTTGDTFIEEEDEEDDYLEKLKAFAGKD